ncbi:hypothetical protein EB796_020139 [Bugula neritina]|uniref:Uncharacterized protein n=1 Tax=Bugula neritina TaxID=10212 RepID=A0A7J7J5Z4_BUGNE|nr:hypothetical protein EB796_020139 [Bugula neritina]
MSHEQALVLNSRSFGCPNHATSHINTDSLIVLKNIKKISNLVIEIEELSSLSSFRCRLLEYLNKNKD